MRSLTRIMLSCFVAFVLIIDFCYSQGRPHDLTGYQEHRFGELRSVIEHRLKENNDIITESTDEAITVTTEIAFDNILIPISIVKSYDFFQGKLWNVTLRYLEPEQFTKTDSIAMAILRQLYSKYGQPELDTTMVDPASIGRFARWTFPSGQIAFASLKVKTSVKRQLSANLSDLITVTYSQAGISELLKREKRAKTAREF